MGLTFEELGVFGRLRKIARCGPVAMFERARHIWPTLPVAVVADKVLYCLSSSAHAGGQLSFAAL
jgi:NAD+ synthase (glutamine-hydrolysing)